MIINFNGQNYDIVNWDEFAKKFLNAVAFQVVSEIQDNIKKSNLIQSSNFWQSIQSAPATADGVEIFSDAHYAPYLEYGTYAYWNKYGLDNFPMINDPKKKDLAPKARKKYPKGMQPFANFRRVLYNPAKMEQIIDRAAKAANK